MKKIFFILTLASVLHFSESVSAFSGCEHIRYTPKINVYTSYGKLRYDFSKTQMDITKIAMNYGKIEKGLFASGLATIKIQGEVNLETQAQPMGKNYACVYPTVINYYVGLKDPVIYVDKDLRRGSCQYNLILRHERAHQQINIKTLEYFLPIFRQALHKLSREIKATPAYDVSASGLQKTSQQVILNYNNRMDKVMNVFKKELEIEQGKLDNMSNYEFESSICQ